MECLQFGYPKEAFEKGYYTANVAPGFGICIASMSNAWLLQMFPWPEDFPNPKATGHEHYCNFILQRAGGQKHTEKFWPMLADPGLDLLTIKCLVEEGINQCRLLSK